MRTPLTPDLVSESLKGQGDHSMGGRSRIGESPTPRAISARCVWQELYCPNSSPPVYVGRPRRKVARSRRDQGSDDTKVLSVIIHPPWRTLYQGEQGTNGVPNHIVSHFAANAGSPTQGNIPLNGDRASILLNVAPVMDAAEDKSAMGAHMSYRRRYKAPVTGTESPTAWEEGKQPTSHHVNRQRGLC